MYLLMLSRQACCLSSHGTANVSRVKRDLMSREACSSLTRKHAWGSEDGGVSRGIFSFSSSVSLASILPLSCCLSSHALESLQHALSLSLQSLELSLSLGSSLESLQHALPSSRHSSRRVYSMLSRRHATACSQSLQHAS